MKSVLYQFGKENIWSMLLLFLAVQSQGLVLLAFPFVNVVVYDNLLATGDPKTYVLICVLVLLLLLAFACFSFLVDFLMSEMKAECVSWYRRKYFGVVVRKQYVEFVSRSPGEIVQRVIPDTDILGESVVKVFHGAFFSVQSAVLFIALWMIDKKMFAIFFVLFTIYGAWTYVWNGKIKLVNQGVGKVYGTLYGFVYEILQGVREVKLFNKYDYVDRRMVECCETMEAHQIRAGIMYSYQGQSGSFIPWIGYLIIIGVCAIGPDSNKYSAGFLVSILSLMWRFLSPIDKVTDSVAKYNEGNNALGRMKMILEMKDEVMGSARVSADSIDIGFDSLAYSYGNGRRILESLSFRISPGERVAIVGPSGSGKSTLASILSCFNVDYSGNLDFNGSELRTLEIESVRDHLAVVSQEVFLFNDTVLNNITFGMPIDPAVLDDVIQKAALRELIASLPEKEHTYVGDRGLLLSGGERQRIAIARILLKNPPIIILDEATSALDEVTEKQIWETMLSVFQKKTLICITHRPQLTKGVDRVLRLRNGRLIESDESIVSEVG